MVPIDVVDLPIGSHVGRTDPLAGAVERGAEVIQLNLSALRNWAAPVVRGDEDTLAAADIPIYVHAPYLVNPASADPAVRARSRACIVAEAAAAERIGACGLVVHGGQAGVGSDAAEGIARWAEVLDDLNLPCRLLVENSAGGSSAVAQDVRHWARLVAMVADAGAPVVVETPGPASAQSADIVWPRRHLAEHAWRGSIHGTPH